jgi:hypothetical protein
MTMFSRQLFIIILMIFGMSVHAETEENLALLERSNVSKSLEVKRILDHSDGKLRNYYTFNLRLRGKLVYCHIAKDNSEPKIFCY